jgi:hypothetical protein
MRLQPESIILGSHEWVVRPLTLRQVQEIEPILMESGLGAKGNIGAAIAIVAIALRRDNSEAAAELSEIEATAPEIAAAMGAVLRLGGFIEAKTCGDAATGEGAAGAPSSIGASASTSLGFMRG